MEPEKQDIIIAGVGGQGILTLAGIIGTAALDIGFRVKQSEVHGMAQRGGAVVSHLRLSRGEIASDLIGHGRAGAILAMEPLECLRHLPFAGPGAVLVANRHPVRNMPGYPDADKVLERIRSWPKHVLVDAVEVARKAGESRAVNSVMLGAASAFLVVPADVLRAHVAAFFERKGQGVVDKNLAAFDLGREAAAAS